MRLNSKSLATPLHYDRGRLQTGMVHLGIGAFHRAHVAEYVDNILKFDPSWAIVGASLRHPDAREALLPQDFLYTHIVRRGSGSTLRVIGSIQDVLDAKTQRGRLLAIMADPSVRIVSLTVTEKGYCHDPATGELDPSHPDVIHDLLHPEAPISAPGLLVRAFELRRQAGTTPFTVLCCDNLPANGETAGRVVTDFASRRDKALGKFIAENVSFPSTMVDRIVPATTDADRQFVAEKTGLIDAWPVVTEPFTQWVIEDHFVAGRPDFSQVGVQLVANVKPFEHMKLRMLNGSHSTLAYLGYLSGYQFVSEAIADPAMRELVYRLMTREVMPTLPPDLPNLPAYRDALLERFANPALKHRTWQIAMDGSQKLPQRLLGTIRDNLAKGQSIAFATLGVAAWMRYVTGVDESGNSIEVNDPLANKMKMIAVAAERDPEALVHGLLSLNEVFGKDLAGSEVFRNQLISHVQSLFEHGAKATARMVLATH